MRLGEEKIEVAVWFRVQVSGLLPCSGARRSQEGSKFTLWYIPARVKPAALQWSRCHDLGLESSGKMERLLVLLLLPLQSRLHATTRGTHAHRGVRETTYPVVCVVRAREARDTYTPVHCLPFHTPRLTGTPRHSPQLLERLDIVRRQAAHGRLVGVARQPPALRLEARRPVDVHHAIVGRILHINRQASAEKRRIREKKLHSKS